jgi:hypothetical protein
VAVDCPGALGLSRHGLEGRKRQVEPGGVRDGGGGGGRGAFLCCRGLGVVFVDDNDAVARLLLLAPLEGPFASSGSSVGVALARAEDLDGALVDGPRLGGAAEPVFDFLFFQKSERKGERKVREKVRER